MQCAIFAGDAQNLVLRFVTVLALPETIGPLAKERRFPGEFAIAGNNLVEFRPVEEIIVNHIRDVGTDVEIIREPVVEAAAGIIVPEDSIAVARHQKWHGDVGVVL